VKTCELILAAVLFLAGLAVGWISLHRPPLSWNVRSVTRMIFVTTQVSALVWVYTSYLIAIYATVRLGQVYTMAELSEPAISTILGVSFLKVLENIFEHNNGALFGRSKGDDSND